MVYTNVVCRTAPRSAFIVYVLQSVIAILLVHLSQAAIHQIDVTSIRDNLELAGPTGLDLQVACQRINEYKENNLAHRKRLLRISLSATLTGNDDFFTHEIRGLLLGLKFFQILVNNDIDLNFAVGFCVEDDQGDENRAVEIYTNFTKRERQPNPQPIQLFLGPSNRTFNAAVAEVANSAGTPIVFWSLKDANYHSPWTPQLISSLMRGYPDPYMELPQEAYDRAREKVQTSLSPNSLEEDSRRLQQLAEIFQDEISVAPMEDPGYPARRADAADKPDPDGDMWDKGYEHVFDVTLTENERMYRPLQYVQASGEITGIVILDLDDADCSARAYDAAVKAGFQNVSMVQLVNGFAIAEYIFEGSWRSDGHELAWQICGTEEHVLTAVASYKAMNFMPKVIILDSPAAISRINLPRWTGSYMIAPKQNSFASLHSFKSIVPTLGCAEVQDFYYFEFDRIFRNQWFLDEWPTLMTVHVHAAVGIIFYAMCEVKNTEAFSTAFSRGMRKHQPDSFVGVISFDSKGKCKSCSGGTVQSFPLQQPILDAGNVVPQKSDFRIVLPHNHPGKIPNGYVPAYAHMVATAPTWETKALEVYPCDPGCVAQNKFITMLNDVIPESFNYEDFECVACPRGKYRSSFSLRCLECRDLVDIIYADDVGLAECKACPTGAHCFKDDPALIPKALPGYYRYTDSEEDLSPNVCNKGYDPPERQFFIPCLAPDRCTGDNKCAPGNQGIGCSQCIQGYTYHGLAPNAFVCVECPGTETMVFRLIFVLVIYWLLFLTLSRLGVYAARDTNNLTSPIVLATLRHLHMVGFLFYGGRVEVQAGADAQLFKFPYAIGLFLTQPLQLMQLECLWIDEDEFSTSNMARLQAMFGFGIGVSMSGYVIIGLWYLLSLFFRLVVFFFRVHTAKAAAQGKQKQELSCMRAHSHVLFLKAKSEGIHVERLCLAWTVVAQPMLLMSSAMAMNCVSQNLDEPRLYEDLNYECYRGEHGDFMYAPIIIGSLSFLAAPAVVGLYFHYTLRSNGYWNFRVLYTSGFLQTGYQLPYFFFEIFYLLRTGLVAATLCLNDVDQRDMSLIVIQALFIIWYEFCLPRASNDRFSLSRVDKFSQLTLFFTTASTISLVPGTTAYQLLMGTDFTKFIVDDPERVIVLVALANIAFLFYALWCYLYNRVFLPWHIHRKTGGDLNFFQRFTLAFVVMIHGFRSLKIETGRNHEITVDLGKIKEKERVFLLRTLQETLQVCMESVHILDISMVVAAMNEIFVRAGQTRDIRVMQDESGGNDRLSRAKTTMVKSTPLRRFNFLFATPPSRSVSVAELTTPVQRRSASRYVNMAEHGITVDELYGAFCHVAVDVITHEPAIHRLNLLGMNGVQKGVFYAHLDHEMSQPKEKIKEHVITHQTKQEKEILANLQHAFQPIGKKNGDILAWGELKDFISNGYNVNRLEQHGLSSYDALRAFTSIAGRRFLKVGAAGTTGVNNTSVDFLNFLMECGLRQVRNNERMKEMNQVKQVEPPQLTFTRNAEMLARYTAEDVVAQAHGGDRKTLELRCEEALLELTLLRLDLQKKQAKHIRSDLVQKQKVGTDAVPDLQKILGGNDSVEVRLDADTLLTKFAKMENMHSKMPDPQSIVSPRMRGIDIVTYAKRLSKSLHEDADPLAKAEELPEFSRTAEPGSNKFGALPAAAAIMARAIATAVGDEPERDVEDPINKREPAKMQIVERSDEPDGFLEFCFNPSSERQVHHEVFKAMMLSQFRGCGVSQKSIIGLHLEHRAGPNLIVDIRGPLSAINELRNRNLTHLKVMGHTLRYIQEPIAKQNTPHTNGVHALEDTQASGRALQADEKMVARTGLVWALSELRFIEAARQAEKLKASGTDISLMVGEQAFARMNNADARFKECLEVLSETFEIKESWAKESISESKTEFGCQVGMGSFGYLNSVLTTEFEGSDPFRAFTALQELDLAGALLGPLQGRLESVKDLWPSGRPKTVGESAWQILSGTEELKAKEDNIWQISWTDALDEPLGCLWVCACSTSEEKLEVLPGLVLPEKTDERTRADHKVFFCIRPFRPPRQGFRLTVVSIVKLSLQQYNLFWMMPPWGLCRTVKPLMVDFPARFHAFACAPLSGKDDLEDRMKSSRYTKTFDILRQHLEKVKDKL